MPFSALFFRLFRFLLPPALVGTVYLYLYPLFQACSFPEARHAETACYFGDDNKAAVPGEQAPFRLLAFGDPQIEGDTSLPDRGDAIVFANLKRLWEEDGLPGFLTSSLSEAVKQDFPKAFQAYRKRLDLWGNDLYLAHVYRSVKWWTDPTHMVVLGDLLGSQWIDDAEFARRTDRFWNRVFRGSEKVPQGITGTSGKQVQVLGADERWKKRIIAVAGNHDIGYAGDIDEDRMRRFEDAYGSVNWEVRFSFNDTDIKPVGGRASKRSLSTPELRLVVLNSMNLDEPAKDGDLRQASVDFVNKKLYWELPSSETGTILLTHIPFHKEAGVCTDAPLVDLFDERMGGGIKEQNHLSLQTSEHILNGIIGPERNRKAVVLNGHDHSGCDVYHSRPREIDLDALTDGSNLELLERWETQQYHTAGAQARNDSLVGVREVTVRSMMGDYGGNAGLLSAWWDRKEKVWKFDYASCTCGVQHIWWAVHVLDIFVAALGLAGVLAVVVEELRGGRSSVSEEKKRA